MRPPGGRCPIASWPATRPRPGPGSPSWRWPRGTTIPNGGRLPAARA